MANRHCAKCGEEYSDTYRSCPFCEEEEAIARGKPLRRRGGKRVEKRQPSGGAGGVMLLVTGVIILCVLGYVFLGDRINNAAGIRPDGPDVTGQDDEDPAQSQGEDPNATPETPSGTPEGTSPGGEPAVSTPEGTDPAGEEPQPDTPPDPAEPLALSQPNITIPAGETGRLTTTGGSGTVTWTSSNENIATVDGGAVTGKAGGTATITAACGGESVTCTVTVTGDPWVNPNAASFKLNKTDFTFSSGEPVQMKVKRDDVNWEILGSADGVVWASANTAVATISDTGLISWAGKGTTTVTATVDGVTLECIVRAK